MFLKKAFLALGLSALLCAPVHAAEPVTLKFSHVNAENALEYGKRSDSLDEKG